MKELVSHIIANRIFCGKSPGILTQIRGDVKKTIFWWCIEFPKTPLMESVSIKLYVEGQYIIKR